MNKKQLLSKTKLKFESENALHHYLLENLETIEPELKLYGKETLEGLQFKCMGKRLDLLTEDQHGVLLAIEIKLGQGFPESLGQLLGYMAVIKRLWRFAGRYLRGMVLCNKASEHLLYAAQDAGCVAVYELSNDLTVHRLIEATDPILIPGP